MSDVFNRVEARLLGGINCDSIAAYLTGEWVPTMLTDEDKARLRADIDVHTSFCNYCARLQAATTGNN